MDDEPQPSSIHDIPETPDRRVRWSILLPCLLLAPALFLLGIATGAGALPWLAVVVWLPASLVGGIYLAFALPMSSDNDFIRILLMILFTVCFLGVQLILAFGGCFCALATGAVK